MARAPLTWTDIDTANLSPELAASYATMNEAKAKFEADMIAAMRKKGAVPAGKTALFTYRRGLAFAIVDERGAKQAVSF